MRRIDDIEEVNEGNLLEAREVCYQAFNANIDGGMSVEDSSEIIRNRPKKRIQRYWDKAYISRLEGKIIAGISPCPYMVNFRGSTISMVGIGDVFCVEKGTDAIEKLFGKIFDSYSEYGLSVLYPFSDNYYSRYGYTPAFFQDEIVLSRKYIEKYIPRKETTIRKASTEDIAFIKEIYDRNSRHITGTAIRDDELDWRYSSYALSDGGYIAYAIRDKRFILRESIGVNLDQIASFASLEDIDELVINSTFGEDFFLHLPEHNQEVKAYRKMHGMARIIDLESCLMKIPHSSEGSIRMKVDDNMIERNRRTLLYSWSKDGCSISPSDSFDIEIDIRVLTNLAINGFSTRIDANLDLSNLLRSAFPLSESACYEIF